MSSADDRPEAGPGARESPVPGTEHEATGIHDTLGLDAAAAEPGRPMPPPGHYALGHPLVGPRPFARTRSFTRRGGRMPATHQQAWDRLAHEVVLDLPRAMGDASTVVDPGFALGVEQVYGRRAPLVVEIGSGAGDALVTAAKERPGWDFLAFEVWRPGIGHTLAKMGSAALPNVRVVEADASLALQTLLPAGSVHEVWTFFPDPWPKARHHKRRIVSPELADTVLRLLEPDGVWRLATDWDDYAEAMREVLDAHPGLRLVSTDRAPLRPVTRFERRGTEAGRAITDLAYAPA